MSEDAESLQSRIDRLYRLPLDDLVVVRNELSKERRQGGALGLSSRPGR